MSTIPIIFNTTAEFPSKIPPYTLFGGEKQSGTAEKTAPSGISAIILSRNGAISLRAFLQNFTIRGYDEIIVIERSAGNDADSSAKADAKAETNRFALDELSREFSSVRFLLFKEHVTIGAAINAASRELSTPFFFVLWTDLSPLAQGGAPRLVQFLYDAEGKVKRLCTVPVVKNAEFEALPTLVRPFTHGRIVETTLFSTQKDDYPSLFPFDAVGIYNREKFFSLGGFDASLENFHWQLSDFGFRSWLWGEEIACSQFVQLKAEGNDESRAIMSDASYRHYYLKNCAPSIRADTEEGAHLPLRAFFPFLARSGLGPLAAFREFRAVRHWIAANKKRWTRTPASLESLWER